MAILIPVTRKIPLEEATVNEKMIAARNSDDLELCRVLASENNVDIKIEILKNKHIYFWNKYYWFHKNTCKEIQDNLWEIARCEIKQMRETTAVWVFVHKMFDGPYDTKNEEMVKAVFLMWFFFAKLTRYDSDTWQYITLAECYIEDNILGDEKKGYNWALENIFCVANMFWEDTERAKHFEEDMIYNVRGRFMTCVDIFKEVTKNGCPEDVPLNKWYIILGKMFYLTEEKKITDKKELFEKINSIEEFDEKLFEQAYECFKMCI